MNAYIRLKRALTEEEPQATSYREDLWGELNDYKETPISISISLLESIHYRLIKILEGLKPEDYNRRFSTQVLGLISVDTALQRFIWHNNHHTAQIKELRRRMQW
ncbi:putative metal-dependent hydrolase YfiT [compost metagenome]